MLRQVDAIDAARRRLRGARRHDRRRPRLDLAAERARFEVGRAGNFDVLRRQEELAVSRLLVAARARRLPAATAALEALTGDILARYGVTTL